MISKRLISIVLILFVYQFTFGQDPGWSVNPASYSANGSITTVVFFNSAEVTTGTLGAFVGDECRGYVDGTVFPSTGKTVFMLMCYSNSASGEILTFKYYNPAEDKVYDISETAEFVSDMNLGSPSNPLTYSAITNVTPVIDNPVPDQSLNEGFGTATIDLTNVFSDPDGDNLTLTAVSSDVSVVTVDVSGTTLTITEVGLGTATVTVTASDGTLSVDNAFTVAVNNVNDQPTIDNPVSDQSLNEGFGTSTVDLTNVFSDPDGDDLTLTAVSSDVSVVTVSISGTTLTIAEEGVGTSNITITASDGNGGEVSDIFVVDIKQLEVDPANINLGYQNGSNSSFELTSANVDWTITGMPAWLNVTPVSGSNSSTISVTINENNPTTSTRSATLSITGGDITRSVTVTQAGAPSLEVSTDNLTINWDSGSSETFNITSENTSWTISDDASWLDVNPVAGSSSQSVTVTANQSNPNTTTRSATVTVTDGTITRTITITQNGAPSLQVSVTTISLAYQKGSNSSFELTSANVDWTITGIPAWLNVTPVTGNSSSTITLTATEENPETTSRSATLTVSGGGISKTVKVTQDGAITTDINSSDVNLLKIYPNSTTGKVNIVCEGYNIQQIHVSDLKGRIMLERLGNSDKESINLSGLKNGIYVISVRTTKHLYTQKIVKR